MNDRISGLLGLMRKASAICPGEDKASEAVFAGKARLLLLPSDAAPGKRERAERYTDGRSCMMVNLPCTQEELAAALGIGGCTMAAVTDLGFASALMKLLKAEDPKRYGAAAEETEKRLEKLRRRKSEKPGRKAGKK